MSMTSEQRRVIESAVAYRQSRFARVTKAADDALKARAEKNQQVRKGAGLPGPGRA